MIGGGVAAFMVRHADQLKVDLQGRGADQPGELVLGLDLLRHQVQEANAQGADVLLRGAARRHDHDALVPQNIEGGQGFRKRDRHDEP